MGLKLVSEGSDSRFPKADKVVLYKQAGTDGIALTGLIFVMGMMLSAVITSLAHLNMLAFAVMALFVTGMTVWVYKSAKKSNFITELCNNYGYSLENFYKPKQAGIHDLQPEHVEIGKSKVEQRIQLPVPVVTPNVDVFVIRNHEGTFIEEVHNHVSVSK